MSIKLSHAAAAKNKQLENIRKPNQQYTLHFNFSFCLYVCLFYAPRTQTFSQDSPTWIQTEKRQYPGILRALDRIRWALPRKNLGMAFPPRAPSPLNRQQSSDWSHPTTLQSWCCSENPQLSPAIVGDWWENKWMQSYKYTICITNHEFHCGWKYIRFIWLISVCWWKFSDTFCKFLQIGEARVRLLHDAVWTKASLCHRLRVGRLLWGWQCQHLCLAFALGFGLPTTLKQFHKMGYLRVLMLMVFVFFQMLGFFSFMVCWG